MEYICLKYKSFQTFCKHCTSNISLTWVPNNDHKLVMQKFNDVLTEEDVSHNHFQLFLLKFENTYIISA